MNKKTILALEGSIEKWKKIVDFLRYKRELTDSEIDKLGTLERGADNCPLCQLFPGYTCSGCPVDAKTNGGGCINTPYYDYTDEENSILLQGYSCASISALRAAAKKELKFLESLREV